MLIAKLLSIIGNMQMIENPNLKRNLKSSRDIKRKTNQTESYVLWTVIRSTKKVELQKKNIEENRMREKV